MRGRELGDKRTQLSFCRSSLHRRLGAAGDLDFNLDGTAYRGFFLHAHNGSLGLNIACRKRYHWQLFLPSMDQGFFRQIREVDGVPRNYEVAAMWFLCRPVAVEKRE